MLTALLHYRENLEGDDARAAQRNCGTQIERRGAAGGREVSDQAGLREAIDILRYSATGARSCCRCKSCEGRAKKAIELLKTVLASDGGDPYSNGWDTYSGDGYPEDNLKKRAPVPSAEQPTLGEQLQEAYDKGFSDGFDTKAAEQNYDEQKWREYERDYILPCFHWAKEDGIDLESLVKANPSRNCVELYVNALRERGGDK